MTTERDELEVRLSSLFRDQAPSRLATVARSTPEVSNVVATKWRTS